MPRWASLVEIAGVSLTGCRALLQGGNAFALPKVGSIQTSANGTPHIQYVETGQIGRIYGVQIPYAEADKLQDIMAAVNVALGNGQPFVNHITDALYDVHNYAWPDFNRGMEWFTHGPESEGIIENVSLWFVSVAPYV